ncbi:MAG: N-acetyltransferase [Muribaculaceae bacterium]|nr:N-acetyltransferase [Muribaculaceae bacterium]
MNRTFRKARMEDVPVIMRLIDEARGIMRSCGNMNQWIDGYPSRETIVDDINSGHCYVCEEDGGELVASFAFIPGPEPTYKEIYDGQWLDDKPYHVVHRLASTASSHGIFHDVMDYCMAEAGNLRIDTHRDNVIMRHVIERYGFTYCGIIYLASGDERLAYQLERG